MKELINKLSNKYLFLWWFYLLFTYSFFVFFVILSKFIVYNIYFVFVIVKNLSKLLKHVELLLSETMEELLIFTFKAFSDETLS